MKKTYLVAAFLGVLGRCWAEDSARRSGSAPVVNAVPSGAPWAPPPEFLTPGATESLAWTAAVHSENLALAAGMKATSSNTPAPASAVPAQAIDGNPRSEWATADAGAILQLEFPGPTRVNGVSLVRDIATEHPGDSGQGAVFEIDASADGQAWATVAASGKNGARVTQWAALFPEREIRFLRLRVTRGAGRLGEMGAFWADLAQAKKWGWDVPEAACRAPLGPFERDADHRCCSAGAKLALARGNTEGVLLPQSARVATSGRVWPTLFLAADPALPEVGYLYWHEEPASPGPRWLYFNVGPPEEAQPPAPDGEWIPAGFHWRGQPVARATPGRPVWVASQDGGWVIPPGREGLRVALSTVWDNFTRGKLLAAAVEVDNSGAKAFRGQLRLALTARRSAVNLASRTLELAAGTKAKQAESLDLSRVASGDYTLTAQLVRGQTILAEAQRPVYVAPVMRPGMSFGIYGVPYWDGVTGLARGVRAAAEAGFTEITGQYWGEGYSVVADRGLRYGLAWNPTIEPIYNQNPLADQDPAAACTGPDGKRVQWHPSTCYTHPEVAQRTEAEAEKWLREIVMVPGFAGYIEVDDDVHLANEGCYNASCRDLFKQVTGLEVPPPKADNPSQPKDLPPPGLIPDDQPWLQWYLFRCSHIRGNLPKIYMRAKNRVNPDIQMGAVRGHMQFPFYTPSTGEYPPLFDALYDAPGSYAYLYWVRPMEDYIAHGALAAMGNRGKGPWILGDFANWPVWILEKGGDGRWELALMKSLQEPQTSGSLYPPGELNKQVWCMLAGGFKRLHMFFLPERGSRSDLAGTEDEHILQTWGARARAYGRLMTALQEPVRPVVILTSISTSAFTDGFTHSGNTSAVFKDCLREHVPVDMIAEEEILAGGLAGRQVLLLPDLQYLRRSVAAAIEKWAEGGGIVLADTGAAVQPAGSRAVKRAAMAREAAPSIPRQLECDNPLVVAREFDLDGVRYYYLVNLYTDRWSAGLADDPWVAGDNSIFTEAYTPRAQKAHLQLPAAARQVWDVFGNREYAADAGGNVEVTVGGDDGMLLALYPQSPDQMAVQAPSAVKAGDEVAVEVSLRGTDGKPVRGGVPVQVMVTDPNGADSEYSQYALVTAGTARVAFQTAVNDSTGTWRVQVRSLVGSVEGSARVRVTP